jgi:hypothetical protein
VIGETLQQFFRSFRRAPFAWLGMIIIATGTDLVDLIFGATGSGLSDLQVVSLVVRFIGVFWLAGVAVRKMIGSPAHPWSLDRGFAFFFVWQIAVFVLEGVVSFLLAIAKNVAAPVLPLRFDPYALTLIFVALATPIVDLLSLRIAPWVAGRTSRVAEMTFGAAWRGMHGNWRAAAKAYLLLVLPLFVIHYALTAWLQRGHTAQHIKLGWTVFDGIESVIMLMLLLSLFVAAFRRATRTDA